MRNLNISEGLYTPTPANRACKASCIYLFWGRGGGGGGMVEQYIFITVFFQSDPKILKIDFLFEKHTCSFGF